MRFIFFGLVLTTSVSFAQRDSTNAKVVNHYVGIQVNQLFKQIFNLSNSTTVVSNPYLINYAVNSTKSGWGLNLGIGYTVDNFNQTDANANTTTDTQINNFSFRIGVERKVSIAKKWMLSYGFDLLSDKSNNTTNTKSEFQLNTNETDTNTITKDSGFGPRFTLNYYITPKILLGTELTYYYKAINIGQNNTNTFTNVTIDPNTGQRIVTSNTSTTDTNQKLKQFHFSAPAILFLILKF
ncbi:MAG: hypothetical protein JST48_01500 [Bacteroidetes bacterium]|nr:hypothetical protein [Bacteroidota bacterium]